MARAATARGNRGRRAYQPSWWLTLVRSCCANVLGSHLRDPHNSGYFSADSVSGGTEGSLVEVLCCHVHPAALRSRWRGPMAVLQQHSPRPARRTVGPAARGSGRSCGDPNRAEVVLQSTCVCMYEDIDVSVYAYMYMYMHLRMNLYMYVYV